MYLPRMCGQQSADRLVQIFPVTRTGSTQAVFATSNGVSPFASHNPEHLTWACASDCYLPNWTADTCNVAMQHKRGGQTSSSGITVLHCARELWPNSSSFDLSLAVYLSCWHTLLWGEPMRGQLTAWRRAHVGLFCLSSVHHPPTKVGLSNMKLVLKALLQLALNCISLPWTSR